MSYINCITYVLGVFVVANGNMVMKVNILGQLQWLHTLAGSNGTSAELASATADDTGCYAAGF